MPKTTWMQHAVKIFGRISWCALQLWHDITQYMYYIYGAKILKVERRSCILFCLLSDCRNGGRSKNLRGNNIVKNGWDGAKRLDQWITYIVLGCLFFLLGGGPMCWNGFYEDILYWETKCKVHIFWEGQFCEIFPLLLTVCTVVKSKGKILQNFVAFSEYMNFNCRSQVWYHL